jgi:hypothetical protein
MFTAIITRGTRLARGASLSELAGTQPTHASLGAIGAVGNSLGPI